MTVRATSGEVEAPAAADRGRTSSFLPVAFVATGAGLMLVSVANALARAGEGTSPVIAWIGMLVMALPIFYRLISRDATIGERLALVCLLGIGLYGVKVLRDAPFFTFGDELIHTQNANQIGVHHHLFHENSILKVTPYYPGVEGAVSALTSITGISIYAAGTIVIGVARVLLMVTLFILFRRVSGSARVAGLGTALYATNFNFMFQGAQFAYEPLALPLLLMVMMAVAERESESGSQLRDWSAPILLGIAAIVVTHHLTSYATVIVLAVLSLLGWFVNRTWRPPNPWRFAVFAAVLAAFWLFVVASSTVGYLTPVLSNAFDAIGNTVQGEKAPRGLFQGSSAAAGETPFPARILGVGGVLLLLLALPFGLRQVWTHFRRRPFAIIFCLSAIGFFGTLALRLTPPAWETGNRASEFLFIGLAFVLAFTVLWAMSRWSESTRTKALLTGAFGVVLLGSTISGWPWDLQLTRPLEVGAKDGGTIVSQPLASAEWTAEELPDGRFATATADADLMLAVGGQTVIAGPYPNVEDILSNPKLEPWQTELLREEDLRYLVADRRVASTDVMRGYYFATKGESAGGPLLQKRILTKYLKLPRASRIYTNGSISIYDLEARK